MDTAVDVREINVMMKLTVILKDLSSSAKPNKASSKAASKLHFRQKVFLLNNYSFMKVM